MNFSVPLNKLLVVGGVGLLAGSAFLWHTLLHVQSRDSVVEVKTLSVKSPIAGVLSDLNVVAGGIVKEGQILFQVEDTTVPKPRVSDLQIQLSALESNLQVLEQRNKRNEVLLKEARSDQKGQTTLQVSRHTEELRALEKVKKQAIQELSFSKREYARKKILYNQGAYSFDLVDRAKTTMDKAGEEVALIQNRIQAQKRVIDAAKRNLTLIATRGGADPESRLRDTTTEHLKTKREIEALKGRIKNLTAQVESAKEEFFLRSTAAPESPVDGVVWKVDLQSGSGVKERENVLYILDCRDRWVNAYVREGDLKRIRVGQRAEVKLFGSGIKLPGEVSLIRSGIGRSSEGGDFLKLLPINIYRESQVRIRIQPTKDIHNESGNMCFAGYTGTVTFL